MENPASNSTTTEPISKNNKYLIPIVILLIVSSLAALTYFLTTYKNQSFISKEKQQKKVFKVGIIQNASNMDLAHEGFVQKMEELGYKEGDKVLYLHNNINSDATRAKEVAENYVQQKVDLILSMGINPTRAAKEATKGTDIPIVFTIVANPVGNKFIQSFQSPGGNLTGVDSAQSELSSKRLSLLKEVASKISKVLIFYSNPEAISLETLRNTANSLGIKLVERKVTTVEELDKEMRGVTKDEFDAIFRTADSITSARAEQLIALSKTFKVPFSGTNSSDTENGGLMSYGANFFKFGTQAADLVDKVLQGKKPAEIPSEQPRGLEFYINLKTANEIGITVLDSVLQRADKVIR